MDLENIIQLLIIIHASTGGIALLAGIAALIAKKGKKIHKKTGKLFFVMMLISCFSALIITVLPKHENPFLFGIGIFSSYLILTGFRALKYPIKNVNLTFDKIIAYSMVLTGLGMILLPIVLSNAINIILTVFGSIGIFLAIRDLQFFKNPKRLKQNWLQLHIGKMTGGFISAATAFVVVNQLIPSIFGWFVPGILGSFIIIYWIRKTKRINKNEKI